MDVYMTHAIDKTVEQPLSVLVGCQLGAVAFVQDYVQLHFDGPCLTAITHPRVRVGNTWFAWRSPGYRDQLCERISRTVSTTSIMEGQEICVEFDDHACISVSLRTEDYRAAEAAMFDDGQGGYWVW
jgi:hypothetical protein